MIKPEDKINKILEKLVEMDENIPKIVVDIGANSEAPISDFLMRKYDFSSYLFEPQQECIDKLTEKFSDQSAKIFKCALSDISGSMPLYESSDGPGGECATLYNKDDPWMRIAVNRNKTQIVEVLTGNQIFEEEEIFQIGVLKIDTEGFDYKVLKGIDLKKFRPALIITEEYLWDLEATFSKYDYLENNDYILCGFLEYNSIWVAKGYAEITASRIALASKHYLPGLRELLNLMHPLERLFDRKTIPADFRLSDLELDGGIRRVDHPEDKLELFFYIRNCGKNTLTCCDDSGNRQIAVSYHLLDLKGNVLVWDGLRTPLPADIAPGEDYNGILNFTIPEELKIQGCEYRIALDIVDEGFSWYSESSKNSLGQVSFKLR